MDKFGRFSHAMKDFSTEAIGGGAVSTSYPHTVKRALKLAFEVSEKSLARSCYGLTNF